MTSRHILKIVIVHIEHPSNFPIEDDPHRQARILNSHAVAGYSAAAKSLTQRMAREPGGHC